MEVWRFCPQFFSKFDVQNCRSWCVLTGWTELGITSVDWVFPDIFCLCFRRTFCKNFPRSEVPEGRFSPETCLELEQWTWPGPVQVYDIFHGHSCRTPWFGILRNVMRPGQRGSRHCWHCWDGARRRLQCKQCGPGVTSGRPTCTVDSLLATPVYKTSLRDISRHARLYAYP